VAEAGEVRARIWRLYLATSALDFEAGKDAHPAVAGGEERRRREWVAGATSVLSDFRLTVEGPDRDLQP